MNGMRSSTGLIVLIVLGVAVLLQGCGGPPKVDPASVLDTKEAAYERGMAELGKGNAAGAKMAFERAVGLGRRWAPGYEGLGLAHLELGDLDAAMDNLRKSLRMDLKYMPANVGIGRVFIAKGKYRDARAEFRDALRRDSANTDALYWMGKSYQGWGKPAAAWEKFSEVLEIDPGNQRASKALMDLAREEAATQGVPDEYAKIAGVPEVTREDIAALMAVELKPASILKHRSGASGSFQAPQHQAGQVKRPSDIPADHWAAKYIQTCLDTGLMAVFPGRKFMPKRAITRADFAVALQVALVAATGDEGLSTRYVGTASEFADVPTEHYALNAVKVVSTRGLITADLNGKFDPTGAVSGTEALLILKKLRALIEE